MRTRLIICLDGIGPDYLTYACVPTLDELGRRGWRTVGWSAMPAVTNVNNVSIITSNPPAVHGITANYYLDGAEGQAIYMEAADFILSTTIFEWATQAGRRSTLITAKDKLRTLLERGATEVISAESPPAWLVERFGPPPPILSVEVNHWLFQAATALCRIRPPDLLYLSTTDYAQHMHAPESSESLANLATLDSLLADLLNSGPEFAVVLTADHGMAAKTRGLDLGQILIASMRQPPCCRRNMVSSRSGRALRPPRGLSYTPTASATCSSSPARKPSLVICHRPARRCRSAPMEGSTPVRCQWWPTAQAYPPSRFPATTRRRHGFVGKSFE